MLINAIHPEECRVAVADGDNLLELEVERSDLNQLKGNIYKAEITRIEPSLQAAFLDIGSKRNGFLQINDINPAYFSTAALESGDTLPRRPAIQEVLKARQELVVQVVKDERDAKGATLTTNISIPGRYLVLMIGNQRGGVSRKISDSGQRTHLREAIRNLKIPGGMGVIVRTAGINRSVDELQRDLDGLVEIWQGIVEKSLQPGSPVALYKESNLAIRTIRDFLTNDVDEILIDEWESFQQAREFVNKIVPSFSSKVLFYDHPKPLFSNFHLDAQVEATHRPEVQLPSGGSIVINQTEAVVTCDVNSGRATTQSDVEETAFATNKEAAEMLAQQLRLRDLGGLIIVDFIDMIDKRHKQVVEKALKDAVRGDRAKVEIGRISKFGLLEMSRQRLKASLASQSHMVCPHCEGRGRVKSPEAAALEALRKIQSAVFAGGVKEIRVRMAPSAALFLLNTKRKALTALETETGIPLLIYPDGRMKLDQYELEIEAKKTEEEIQAQASQSMRSGQHSHGPRNDRHERGDRNNPRQGRGRNRRQGGNNNQRRNRNDNRRGPQRDAEHGERGGENDQPRRVHDRNFESSEKPQSVSEQAPVSRAPVVEPSGE